MDSTLKNIEFLSFGRQFLSRYIKDLRDEQLHIIPDGFSNNMLWNIAHLVVTQQLLHYGLSKVPMLVDNQLIAENRKGTSPKNWTQTPDRKEIMELLLALPNRLATDYKNGVFQEYKTYETSAGFRLTNVQEAIAFNYFHEGMHIGIIMAMKKLV